MITNTDWNKSKVKPSHHQISFDCIKKFVNCIEEFNKGEIDADTTFKIQMQILTQEIEGKEFLEIAIDNLSEMIRYFVLRI